MPKLEVGSIVTILGGDHVKRKIISIDISVNRAVCEWKDPVTKEIKTAFFDMNDLRVDGESVSILDIL